jgi:hypothetical protein
MRRLLAAIIGLMPGLGWAEAFTDLCNQRLPAARVQVRATVAEPKISFELTAGEIGRLSGTGLPGVSLGLTRVDRQVERQVEFSTLRQKVDGRMCARPRIDITVALRDVEVYVARELSGDACLIGEVWHHELRHYAIWQETVTQAAAELERLMQRHYDGVVLTGSGDEISARIETELRGRWAGELDALIARGDVEHQLLDGRDALGHAQWCEGALLKSGRELR